MAARATDCSAQTGTESLTSVEHLVGARKQERWRFIASVLTDREVDDGLQVGPLIDQVDEPVASFTGDGGYDRDNVCAEVAARHPAAAGVLPP